MHAYNMRDRMSDNISKFDLIKQNVKQFFFKIKSRKESPKISRIFLPI